LVIFLILSLLLHALCFYIFQIVYPPTVALMPPPARVTLISPDNPESLAFLRWVEAEDPALTTTTQRLPETKTFALPPVEHRPSYATHQPKLKTLSPPTPDLSIPSSAAIGRLPQIKVNAAGPGLARKTTAQFGNLPAALGDPSFADFKFRLHQPGAPANARFRVAIDERGTIRFCFLIESSGDPALDEQARSFLQLCRFKTKENSSGSDGRALFWTSATILWGNDLAPSPSPPAKTSP
jgi:outer membrane biosynthesis protein TonB